VLRGKLWVLTGNTDIMTLLTLCVASTLTAWWKPTRATAARAVHRERYVPFAERRPLCQNQE